MFHSFIMITWEKKFILIHIFFSFLAPYSYSSWFPENSESSLERELRDREKLSLSLSLTLFLMKEENSARRMLNYHDNSLLLLPKVEKEKKTQKKKFHFRIWNHHDEHFDCLTF